MAQRYFTREEAEGLLPWLEEQLTALRALLDRQAEMEEEVQDLHYRARSDGGASLEEEVGEKRQDLERVLREIQERVEAITEKGIILRDIEKGLVDFPARREGREVFLCWLRGEPRVLFWHEVDAGFAGRQPLDEEG